MNPLLVNTDHLDIMTHIVFVSPIKPIEPNSTPHNKNIVKGETTRYQSNYSKITTLTTCQIQQKPKPHMTTVLIQSSTLNFTLPTNPVLTSTALEMQG